MERDVAFSAMEFRIHNDQLPHNFIDEVYRRHLKTGYSIFCPKLAWDKSLDKDKTPGFNLMLFSPGSHRLSPKSMDAYGYLFKKDPKWDNCRDTIFIVHPYIGKNSDDSFYEFKLFHFTHYYATFFPADELNLWWKLHPQWMKIWDKEFRHESKYARLMTMK